MRHRCYDGISQATGEGMNTCVRMCCIFFLCQLTLRSLHMQGKQVAKPVSDNVGGPYGAARDNNNEGDLKVETVRSPQPQVPRREDIISLQDFNVMEHNDMPHGSGSNKEKLEEMTISDTSAQLTSIYCPYNNDLPCFLTIESCHIGYLNGSPTLKS